MTLPLGIPVTDAGGSIDPKLLGGVVTNARLDNGELIFTLVGVGPNREAMEVRSQALTLTDRNKLDAIYISETIRQICNPDGRSILPVDAQNLHQAYAFLVAQEVAQWDAWSAATELWGQAGVQADADVDVADDATVIAAAAAGAAGGIYRSNAWAAAPDTASWQGGFDFYFGEHRYAFGQHGDGATRRYRLWRWDATLEGGAGWVEIDPDAPTGRAITGSPAGAPPATVKRDPVLLRHWLEAPQTGWGVYDPAVSWPGAPGDDNTTQKFVVFRTADSRVVMLSPEYKASRPLNPRGVAKYHRERPTVGAPGETPEERFETDGERIVRKLVAFASTPPAGVGEYFGADREMTTEKGDALNFRGPPGPAGHFSAPVTVEKVADFSPGTVDAVRSLEFCGDPLTLYLGEEDNSVIKTVAKDTGATTATLVSKNKANTFFCLGNDGPMFAVGNTGTAGSRQNWIYRVLDDSGSLDSAGDGQWQVRAWDKSAAQEHWVLAAATDADNIYLFYRQYGGLTEVGYIARADFPDDAAWDAMSGNQSDPRTGGNGRVTKAADLPFQIDGATQHDDVIVVISSETNAFYIATLTPASARFFKIADLPSKTWTGIASDGVDLYASTQTELYKLVVPELAVVMAVNRTAATAAQMQAPWQDPPQAVSATHYANPVELHALLLWLAATHAQLRDGVTHRLVYADGLKAELDRRFTEPLDAATQAQRRQQIGALAPEGEPSDPSDEELIQRAHLPGTMQFTQWRLPAAATEFQVTLNGTFPGSSIDPDGAFVTPWIDAVSFRAKLPVDTDSNGFGAQASRVVEYRLTGDPDDAPYRIVLGHGAGADADLVAVGTDNNDLNTTFRARYRVAGVLLPALAAYASMRWGEDKMPPSYAMALAKLAGIQANAQVNVKPDLRVAAAEPAGVEGKDEFKAEVVAAVPRTSGQRWTTASSLPATAPDGTHLELTTQYTWERVGNLETDNIVTGWTVGGSSPIDRIEYVTGTSILAGRLAVIRGSGEAFEPASIKLDDGNVLPLVHATTLPNGGSFEHFFVTAPLANPITTALTHVRLLDSGGSSAFGQTVFQAGEVAFYSVGTENWANAQAGVTLVEVRTEVEAEFNRRIVETTRSAWVALGDAREASTIYIFTGP